MWAFPLAHFANSKPVSKAFADFVSGPRTNTSATDNIDIGPEPEAGSTRHILISLFISDPYPGTVLSCDIGGISATKLIEDTTNIKGGGAVFIAEVPTGTTADIDILLDVSANYCGGVAYALYDLQSPTPVNAELVRTDTAVVSATGINETTNGVLIAMAGYWANTSSDYAFSGTSGVVEDFDGQVSGTNELFAASASKQSAEAASDLTITGTAVAYDDRGHRLFVMEMR